MNADTQQRYHEFIQYCEMYNNMLPLDHDDPFENKVKLLARRRLAYLTPQQVLFARDYLARRIGTTRVEVVFLEICNGQDLSTLCRSAAGTSEEPARAGRGGRAI